MFKGFNRWRVLSILWKAVPNTRGWREKWVVVLLGSCRDCLKVRLVTQIILSYITNSWWYKWGEVFRCQSSYRRGRVCAFLFSMWDFPYLCQTKEIELMQFGCSRNNAGSFSLIFFYLVSLLLGTIVPYNIGIFKKRPYKRYIHIYGLERLPVKLRF